MAALGSDLKLVLAALGKTVLILATVFFALSIGGGMVLAAPVLVPLHWIAARRAGPVEIALWSLLAGLSSGEAVWIALFGLTEVAALGAICGGMAFLLMTSWLLVSHAPRA